MSDSPFKGECEFLIDGAVVAVPKLLAKLYDTAIVRVNEITYYGGRKAIQKIHLYMPGKCLTKDSPTWENVHDYLKANTDGVADTSYGLRSRGAG